MSLIFLLSIVDDYSQASIPTSQGFELSREARAQADLKFTYVVSCQIYGQQKKDKKPEAADIALLLQRYDFLIDNVQFFLLTYCTFVILFLFCVFSNILLCLILV